HDVVHRQRLPGDVEQSVNLRHRRADAPQRTHRPPQVHEAILDVGHALRQVNLGGFHRFYLFQEWLDECDYSTTMAEPQGLSSLSHWGTHSWPLQNNAVGWPFPTSASQAPSRRTGAAWSGKRACPRHGVRSAASNSTTRCTFTTWLYLHSAGTTFVRGR